MEHIINFIFIAPIFLAPVILLRYAILRRAVSKGHSFLIALTYGFIAWIIVKIIQDITLEEPIPSVIPSVIWSIVNYIILCCGKRESIKEPKQKKAKGKMLLGIEDLLFIPICVSIPYSVYIIDEYWWYLYIGVAIATLCSLISLKFCIRKPHNIPLKILSLVLLITSIIPILTEEYWRLNTLWLTLHIVSTICILVVLFVTARRFILFVQNKDGAEEPPRKPINWKKVLIIAIIVFLIGLIPIYY